MTLYERVVVSAYTGVLMCDFDYVHRYIEDKLGRPVFSHEMADPDVQKEISEKTKRDFLALCGNSEKEVLI